jgi:hypothetical protein
MAERETLYACWSRRTLRLYPRAWRERYGDEVALVLARHRVTLWTVFDMLLGAADAHLHPELLPGRLTSMAHRIRTSEIAIFCAWVLFVVAWLPLRFVRDPLPIWQAAVAAHPELSIALSILDVAGIVATLAILAGGLPILAAAVGQSIRARNWRLLLLFAVPIAAAAALVGYGILAIPGSGARQSSAPGAPLTPLAVVLQLGLVVLLLVAVGGSTAAVAAAITRSEMGERILRFALLPAGIATLAITLGLLAGVTLSALVFTEAPQVGTWPPLQVGDALLMLLAAVLAGFALRRGLAARGA